MNRPTVDYDTRNVYIPAGKFDLALAAINKLSSNGVRYFLVSPPTDAGYPTLRDALDEWRFKLTIDDDGNGVIEWTGAHEGDEATALFPALAHCLQGEIIQHVEDFGEKKSFHFEHGRMKVFRCVETWVPA